MARAGGAAGRGRGRRGGAGGAGAGAQGRGGDAATRRGPEGGRPLPGSGRRGASGLPRSPAAAGSGAERPAARTGVPGVWAPRASPPGSAPRGPPRLRPGELAPPSPPAPRPRPPLPFPGPRSRRVPRQPGPARPLSPTPLRHRRGPSDRPCPSAPPFPEEPLLSARLEGNLIPSMSTREMQGFLLHSGASLVAGSQASLVLGPAGQVCAAGAPLRTRQTPEKGCLARELRTEGPE